MKRPKPRPMRAWVLMDQQGIVHWGTASELKRDAIYMQCWGRWSVMYQQGWRVVRCRVEEV